MKSPLNSSTGPQVIRFFDVCFKHGVFDAAASEDSDLLADFIADRWADWHFGIIGEPDDFDWRMYRFRLYQWARDSRLAGLAENYLFRLRSINPYWVLLLFCLRFYLLGAKEWQEYPNPAALDIFKGTAKVHWLPQKTNRSKKFSRSDYFAYMQEFAIDYRRLNEESRLSTPFAMEQFCIALYSVTRCTK